MFAQFFGQNLNSEKKINLTRIEFYFHFRRMKTGDRNSLNENDDWAFFLSTISKMFKAQMLKDIIGCKIVLCESVECFWKKCLFALKFQWHFILLQSHRRLWNIISCLWNSLKIICVLLRRTTALFQCIVMGTFECNLQLHAN